MRETFYKTEDVFAKLLTSTHNSGCRGQSPLPEREDAVRGTVWRSLALFSPPWRACGPPEALCVDVSKLPLTEASFFFILIL